MSAEPWRRSGTHCGTAAFCVAGVVLWGPQAGFAWQVWYFGDLCRCPRNLGDEAGPLWRHGFLCGRRGTLGTSGCGAAAFCVAGVTLSATQARFAWQAWHFQDLHRCPRKLGDELGLIGRRCV